MSTTENNNNGFNAESASFWDKMISFWHENRDFGERNKPWKKKADLVDGTVPANQLPSYVDDVIECETFQNLPLSGEKGKIYIVTTNNTQYRWSGLAYIQINSTEFQMTTNNEQEVKGKKTFYTIGGNDSNKNNLKIYAEDGSLPGVTFSKYGNSEGQLRFESENFHFINQAGSNYIPINASGFKKASSNDDCILLGGGGHKSVKDFAKNYERLGNTDYNSYAFMPLAKSQYNIPFEEDTSTVSGDFILSRYAGTIDLESIGVGNAFESFELNFKNGLWNGDQNMNQYHASILYKNGNNPKGVKLARATVNGINYIGLKFTPDIDKNVFFKGYASKIDMMKVYVYFSVDTGTINSEIENSIVEIPFNSSNNSLYWNNERLALTSEVPDVSDVILSNTPQQINANKNFAQTADVRFYGNEGNEVRVWRDSTGAGADGVVSGHILNWYDTRWKVGNARAGDSSSAGYGFYFSDDSGNTYNKKAFIYPDGNIFGTGFIGSQLRTLQGWNLAQLTDATYLANSGHSTYIQSSGGLFHSRAGIGSYVIWDSYNLPQSKIDEISTKVNAYKQLPYLPNTSVENKWLFYKVQGGTGVGTPRTYKRFDEDNIIFQGVVNEGVNLVTGDNGNNYTGLLRAVLYSATNKTISFSFTHDDGCTIYINGKQVYSNGYYNSGATATFDIDAGYSTIDFIWDEGGGSDGIMDINPSIGSQVDNIYLPQIVDLVNNKVHAINGEEGDGTYFSNFGGKTQIGSIKDDDDAWWNAINIQHRNGLGDGNLWGGQLRMGMNGNLEKLQFRQEYNGSYTEWKTVWNSENFNPANYQPAGDYISFNTDIDTFSAKMLVTYFSSYTPEGLFSAPAKPLKTWTPGGKNILFGYRDYGTGQYYPRIGFKSETNWSLGPIADYFTIGTNNDDGEIFKLTNSSAFINDSEIWHAGNFNPESLSDALKSLDFIFDGNPIDLHDFIEGKYQFNILVNTSADIDISNFKREDTIIVRNPHSFSLAIQINGSGNYIGLKENSTTMFYMSNDGRILMTMMGHTEIVN